MSRQDLCATSILIPDPNNGSCKMFWHATMAMSPSNSSELVAGMFERRTAGRTGHQRAILYAYPYDRTKSGRLVWRSDVVEVTHLTRYSYQPKVDNAQHMAYLTPAQTSHQNCCSIRYGDTSPTEYEQIVDVYGNTRSFFSIQESHTQLSVLAHSIVTTRGPQTSSAK